MPELITKLEHDLGEAPYYNLWAHNEVVLAWKKSEFLHYVDLNTEKHIITVHLTLIVEAVVVAALFMREVVDSIHNTFYDINTKTLYLCYATLGSRVATVEYNKLLKRREEKTTIIVKHCLKLVNLISVNRDFKNRLLFSNKHYKDIAKNLSSETACILSED